MTKKSTSQVDQHVVEEPHAGLVALAEELGRLLARRGLARPDLRRGYSLPELLLGGSVMAVMWVLIARALAWL